MVFPGGENLHHISKKQKNIPKFHVTVSFFYFLITASFVRQDNILISDVLLVSDIPVISQYFVDNISLFFALFLRGFLSVPF